SYRGGLMDTNAYAEELGEKLEQYWKSPARIASGATILEKFWKDEDVQKLSYQRGDVVALLVDCEMRKHGASIDVLMHELVERGRAGEKIDNDSLVASIARHTSEDYAA